MAQFGFKFNLPPVQASDVVTRELSISINGNAQPAHTYAASEAVTGDELVFEVGQNIAMFLTDIDAAGNRSQPSDTMSFQVIDDIAPGQPGALSVASKRQIN